MYLPLTLLALLTPFEPVPSGTERAVADRVEANVQRTTEAVADESPKKPRPQPRPKPKPKPEPRPDPCPTCGMG